MSKASRQNIVELNMLGAADAPADKGAASFVELLTDPELDTVFFDCTVSQDTGASNPYHTAKPYSLPITQAELSSKAERMPVSRRSPDLPAGAISPALSLQSQASQAGLIP